MTQTAHLMSFLSTPGTSALTSMLLSFCTQQKQVHVVRWGSEGLPAESDDCRTPTPLSSMMLVYSGEEQRSPTLVCQQHE